MMNASIDNPSHASSICQKCGGALVPTKKRKAISASGFISCVIFFVGIICLQFSISIGLLIMILGLLIGRAGGNMKTVMSCPKCGEIG